MKEIIGLMIRCHTETGFFDVGRIVHVDTNREMAYYVPYPRPRKEKGTHTSWHVPSPQARCIESLEDSYDHELGGKLTLVNFVPPPQWRLTDEQLRAGMCTNGLVGRRARLNAWLEEREEMKRWIAPIVGEYTVRDLLEFGAMQAAVKSRSEALGHKDQRRVRRALLLWMFGCADPNALLPCKYRMGAPGKEKNFTEKPGRRQKDFLAKRKPTNGYLCTQTDRDNLADGWDMHKKPGVSVTAAYLLTCAQYWPGPCVQERKDGKRLHLAHPDDRPTQTEFRNAAKARGSAGAKRINLGERVHNLCERELRGSSKTGVTAVGQVALIDSTPEDQTPVSSTSRLIVLPTTYRTVVIDVRSEYILGLYCGFENPSTLTSLLAILSAASSKVAYCAKYGVTITEDEWHSRMPKRIRGDNGELKSRLGIDTLNEAGASLEFTASYAAVLKSLVEASHHSTHAHADHLAAGSTKGRRRERGEPDRSEEACRTFEENMPFVIGAIRRHNNEVPVPHLLTPKMVRDGVKPTRAAIYQWYVENGYVASAPTNIDSLRARCLPSLQGAIGRDGIRVVDPRDPREHIPGLRFNSTWLRQSGLCIKPSQVGGHRKVEIKLSPDEIGHCYFEYGGELHRLENQSLDAGSRELTLLEYLEFADARKSAARSMRGDIEESDVARLKDNKAVNTAAKTAKKKEAAAVVQSGGQLTPPRKQSKRANVEREKQLHERARLGLPPVAAEGEEKDLTSTESVEIPAATSSTPEPNNETVRELEDQAVSATAALMARYRATRRFID